MSKHDEVLNIKSWEQTEINELVQSRHPAMSASTPPSTPSRPRAPRPRTRPL